MERIKEIARKDTLTKDDREFLENHCKEVVFCNECEYSMKIKDADVYCCNRIGRAVLGTDFCSRGERKDKQ